MMLEVRHLMRTYRVKNADPVYALNDVSLKFPETGLVFILGKSGSGKSTLLNVMGGLDKADDGEIIINGKSSKEFSGSEMDSYRNTYLGFIFQEYNILSDFTVKENIALALQLQHKKATDEAIENILKEVDLSGYGKRKPNELSGGQKQRVAIARALVKEPKIIFGDEPTGALDSNTGKQVFETLKKLSKTKLVVIVSHDRDFAEHFGDRVIELKDGKVISDITKTSVESIKATSGLSLIGDNMIRIEKNRPLTAEDLPLINKAIENASSDIYITADSHANEALCEAARIDKDGNRQEFVSTDPDKIKMGNDSFDVVKSRFSLGHAFRMGGKSMRVKPFRLVFTIFLSTISFSLFGTSATLAMFSEKSAVKNVIQDNKIDVLSLRYSDKTENGKQSEGLSEEKIAEVKKETGVQIYTSKYSNLNLNVNTSGNDFFHATQMNYAMEASQQMMDDLGFSLTCGNLPTNENEICLSLYAYYSLQDLGTSTIEKPEDVLGMEFSVYQYSSSSSRTLTLTGIIDTKLPEKYLQYRTSTEKLDWSNPDYQALMNLRNNSSIHTTYFYGGSQGSQGQDSDIIINTNLMPDGDKYYNLSLAYYANHADTYFFDKSKASLSSEEALVSSEYFLNLLSQSSSSTSENTYSFTFTGAPEYFGGTDYSFTDESENMISGHIQQAASYKTINDKYSDFYQNDFAIAKAINEGTGPYDRCTVIMPSYDSASGTEVYKDEDYQNATNEQKYQLFSYYFNNYIRNQNDISSSYYNYYLNAISGYQKELANKYSNLTAEFINQQTNEISMKLQNEYISKYYEEAYQKYKNQSYYANAINQLKKQYKVDEVTDTIKKDVFQMYFYQTSYYKQYQSDYKKKQKEIFQNYDFSSLNLSIVPSSSEDDKYSLSFPTFRVVGVDFDLNYMNMAISKNDAETLKAKENEMGISYENQITTGYVGISNQNMDKFLDFYFKKKKSLEDYESAAVGSWKFAITNSEVSTTESYAYMIAILTQVFLYVGIVLAIFSMLLFYNFISVSINNKKREIGILRAVGAKRSDVFKIFYSEAFIIAMFNFVFSTIITFILSYILNQGFKEAASLSFNLMNPNILIILLLFGVAILTSFISSILPVTKIANKKPIDAIQNR